MLAKRKSLSF